MDSKFITFVTIFNILLCVHCYDDSSLRNMVQQWRQRNYVREMLRRLDDRMEQMGQDSRKVKRPCLLNLPGSDCDSMDTLGVAKDQGHWADEMGPGKRKRSNLEEQLSLRTQGLRKRPCSFNLPGTGCENYEIVGTAKDAGHWGSSVSPGRKRNSPIFENYEEE